MIKKILFLFLFNILFLTRVKEILAQEFVKYTNNPIITYDSNISWKSQHVAGPFVIFDNGIFKMWYSAHNGTRWSIAYATSTDGINWSDYPTNPVLTPSLDGTEGHVLTPKIIKNSDNNYFLYYSATPDNSSYIEIRTAQSNDGINWHKLGNYNITLTQPWEKWGIAYPMVTKDSLGYHMWYDSHDGNVWRNGYATSNDGLTWTKSNNNPLSWYIGNASGALFVLNKESKMIGWKHGGYGKATSIYQAESIDYINWINQKSIISISGNPNNFDSDSIYAPSVIIKDNKEYLYYAGSNGQHLQIGLAIREDAVPEKTPVVIIPGFMASWNRDAILHNAVVNTGDWQLTPFVEEYKGIINTFKNLGYVENKDFLVYPYDWRKPLDQDATDLNNFLQQKIWNDKPDAKIDLVGHSLGGLVARTWAQKYNPDKVDKLITVGTPHKGTAQVYKSVEAGEIDKSNDWLWLAEKSILMLNKNTIETDKETVNDRLPILADMLPIEPFLKQNGSNISIDSMQIKNNYLITVNNSLTPILPKLSTVVGQKSNNTLAGYDIGTRTVLDQLLDLYPDGRPIGSFGDTGDYLILAASAGIGDNIKTFSIFNHGELIFKKDAIKEILTELNIPVTDNQIVEGSPTIISPSLIFMIRSPATMEVIYNGNSYHEHDGIIFIPGAQNGDYVLSIHGKENGHYTVLAGRIIAGGDFWNTIDGDIIQTPPTNQTDTYHINFDSNLSQPPLSPESAFDEIINDLTGLRQNYDNTQIASAINSLKQGKILFQSNQISALKSFLLLAHSYLLAAKNGTNDNEVKNKLLVILEKSENLYQTALSGNNEGINTVYLQNKMQGDNDIFSTLTVNLLLQKNQGQNTAGKNSLLAETQNRLTTAQNFYSRQNYLATEITLDTGENLIDDLRKP